jgi:hypothetical protein
VRFFRLLPDHPLHAANERMQPSAASTGRACLALLGALVFHDPALLAEESAPIVQTSAPLLTLEPPQTFHEPVVPGMSSPPSDFFSWRKGPFQIRPYGALWADMVFASERTSPGAFTLFVFSPQEQGESSLTVDTRRTRLGLNVRGPTFGTAETGGRVEIDFQGDFVTENRAGVLLRHAYWEVNDDRTRLLVGQYWDLASPLSPNTVNYGYGYYAGNIGFRRAQFRAERYATTASGSKFALQGSLNQDIVTDFPADPGVRRESSNWPVVEARAAVSLPERTSDSLPATLGISGHIGETGFDFLSSSPPPLNLPPEDDARFLTWSFNVDAQASITERLGFQGEYFLGANLGNFLGGVGQGVCGCSRESIRSTGGWIEFSYEFTDDLRGHLGYGLDDPNNPDIVVGRSSNQFLFVNLIRDITLRWTTGLEVSCWRTEYRESRVGLIPADQLGPTEPGKSVTLDWMMKYEF